MEVLENMYVTARAYRVHFDFAAFAGDEVCHVQIDGETTSFLSWR